MFKLYASKYERLHLLSKKHGRKNHCCVYKCKRALKIEIEEEELKVEVKVEVELEAFLTPRNDA